MRGHHGCIRIRSEVGKGTVIRVLLPVSHEYVDKPAEVEEVSDAQSRKNQGIALVIDDEQTMREVVGEMLKVCGFSILTAEDGLEGVEVLQTNRQTVSLVLLDMTMPRMDGLTCFYKLRKVNPDVKIVVVSGYSKKSVMGRFGEQKADAFLQKPFSLDELCQAVKDVFHDR